MMSKKRLHLKDLALMTFFLAATNIKVLGEEQAYLQITKCIPKVHLYTDSQHGGWRRMDWAGITKRRLVSRQDDALSEKEDPDSHGTRREVWTGLTEGTLAALKDNPRYPNNPNTSEFIQSLEAPRGRGNMYGQKLSAHFIAPETGNYKFYMACDDQCELMVSGDEDPRHAQTLGKITQYTQYRDWNSFPGKAKHSTAIHMTAGHLYYVQAIMAQGLGSNHLSVGAKFPSGRYNRPVSNEFLLRYAPGRYGLATPGEWGQWSSCTFTCGGGVQVRNRTCLDPLPIFSDIDLTGRETTQTRKCIPFYSCPAPPTQINAETIDSSSIQISWSPFILNSSAMELLGYNITYQRFFIFPHIQKRTRRATNQITNQTAITHLIRETDTGHVMIPPSYQSAILSGLASFSTYCIQVATVSNIWTSGLSACVNVTTAEDVPSLAPLNVTTKNLTSAHKVEVTWTPVPSGKHNGVVLGYHIKVRPLTSANDEPEDSSEKVYRVLIPRVRTVLTGLESFTVYSIQVAAFTTIGNGPYSQPVTVETCRCPKRMYANWWILPPLTTRSTASDASRGIFPALLSNMIQYACTLCKGHRETILELEESNPKEKNHSSALKEDQLQVRKAIKRTVHLNYPLSVAKGGQLSGEGFQFVPVIEVSSAVVFIKKKMSSEVYAKMLGSSLFDCWPMVVLVFTLCLLAGTILCILEVISYPEEIMRHSSFMKALYEFSWCAFISMTSVGYGDRFPRSSQGRIFTMAWFIVGYVVICIFVATLASSLSVKIVVTTINPSQGGKVGVLEKTVEYRLATQINGTKGTQCIPFTTLEEMLIGLKQGDIDGILLDVLSSNNLNSSVLPETTYMVAKVFDVSFSYGVGLSGEAIKLEKLFNEYIRLNPVSLDDERKKEKMLQIEEQATDEAPSETPPKKVEEQQINFFDPSNTMYVMSVYFSSGFLIGAILSGFFYHYICSREKPVKRSEEVQDQLTLDLHSKYALMRSNDYQAELRAVLETFYQRCLSISYKLKCKHKEEQRMLLRELRLLQARKSHSRQYRLTPSMIQHHREFKENGYRETTL